MSRAGAFRRVVLPPLAVFIVVVAAAEACVRLAHVPPYVLPTPTAVALTLVDDRALFAQSLWTTTRESLMGFVASGILGVLAAVALSASSLGRRAFYPYTIFFQTVPIIAIAPLLLIWFRAGEEAVIICAFVVSVFPVIANTLNGLRSTDPALVDLFRLYGAGPVASVWKLRLPAALPSLLTGLRVAAGLAVIGAVVAEFLVGSLGEQEGLGVFIVTAARYLRTDQVFGGVLLSSLLGLGMFAVVNAAGFLLLRRWHASADD
jgi:NitT/TauT family transport system permease protein